MKIPALKYTVFGVGGHGGGHGRVTGTTPSHKGGHAKGARLGRWHCWAVATDFKHGTCIKHFDYPLVAKYKRQCNKLTNEYIFFMIHRVRVIIGHH